MKCIYYYNENMQVIEDLNNLSEAELATLNIQRIGTEMELDGYLYDHRAEFLSDLGRYDFTYYLPADADGPKVDAAITEMHVKGQSYAGSPTRFEIKKIWESVNPDTFETFTSLSEQRREEIIQELETTTVYQNADETTRIRLIEEKLKQDGKNSPASKIGTIAGDALQRMLIDPSYDVSTIKREDIFGDAVKNEIFYASLIQSLKLVADKLRNDFKGATFKVEMNVYTDKITDTLKSILNTIAGRSGGVNLIDTILGRVDITAIMPDGSVATIEMKTSKYKLPSSINGSDGTYPSKKLEHYSGQVLTYDIIRKQVGIRSTPYLLNFQTFDDGSIKFDRLLEIPTIPGEGRFGSIVTNGLPLDPPVKIETIDEINTLMGVLFGNNASVGSELEVLKRNIDFFLDPNNGVVKNVSPTDMPDAYARGERKYFIDKSDPKNETIIFAKTIEELKTKLEKYLNKLNEKSSTIWLHFGKKFNSCKNRNDLVRLLQDLGYTGKSVNVISEHLWKYTRKEWKLVDDEVLLRNGVLLFQSGSGAEMIMLEEIHGLFDYHKFPNKRGGTSILGMKYGDHEIGAGNRDVLSAQYGNLMLIKGVSIIAKYPQFFRNGKILNISAVNTRRGEIINNVSNETLKKNWRYLKAAFMDQNMPIVDYVFEDDLIACVSRAQHMLRLCENAKVRDKDGLEIEDVSGWQIFKSHPDVQGYTYEELVKLRENLVKKFGPRTDKLDYRVRKAFDELDKAILFVSGFEIFNEKDNPLYGGEGFSMTGGYLMPFYRSPSANLRMMSEIENALFYKMSELIHKYTTPFQIKLSRALEANEKYSSVLGGEYVMSAKWFVEDENGNIDSSFRFKHPSDPYFIGRDEERELLEYVLETFAELRWPNPDDRLSFKEDPTSEYYECPLYESDMIETFITSNKKIKGIANLLKKRAKRTANVAMGLVQGQERDIKSENVDEILQRNSSNNPFFDPNRKKKIDQNGVDVYTKNIDEIFLYTTITAMKHQVSKELMPIIHSVLELTHSANVDNRAGMQEIEEALKQYVLTVIFDKSGVKTSLLWAQRLLQTLRQWYSVTTLGLNPKALVRDSLSSDLRSAITFLGGNDPKTMGISSNDYFDAYFEMCVHNLDSLFTSSGYDNQLNLIHRMANMSYREIKEQLKTNKFAMGNLESNFLFITSTSSDYVHRMALLKAYLKKLGADEAYVANEDGILKYDMSKDRRWNILFKYRSGDRFSASDRGNVSKEDLEEYDKRWVEYTESVRAWKKSRPEFQMGEELPLALDPDQERSIQSLASNMYGAYTKEEQALIHHTLLGGAFFQFKTYGISRMFDWWKSPGQIAILTNQTLTDDEGNELWEILCTPEEFEATGELVKIVTKDQVSSEDIANNRAKPMRAQRGAIDEGRVQSIWALGAAGYGMNFSNDEKARKELEELFNQRLNDPLTRANIFRGLADTFMSLIIMGFIKIIYPEEKLTNMSNQDWWTRWTYAIMTGVAQDGPIWEVFNSVWGGGEIPVVKGVSRWMTSALGVLNGDDLLAAMFNTFGATRELTSMLDNF